MRTGVSTDATFVKSQPGRNLANHDDRGEPQAKRDSPHSHFPWKKWNPARMSKKIRRDRTPETQVATALHRHCHSVAYQTRKDMEKVPRPGHAPR